MHQIVVEPGLSQRLSELSGQTLVCDENGRTLGLFSPLPESVRADDLRLTPPHSVAETEELRKARTGKPLSEILARLEIQ